MRKIISLICFLLPVMANADVVQVRPDAPDRHIVVKGDTLWDISAMFFQGPMEMALDLEHQQRLYQRPTLDIPWRCGLSG